MGIEDLSPFVAEQRQHVLARHYDLLVTRPRDDVYPVTALDTIVPTPTTSRKPIRVRLLAQHRSPSA
jgi:hypothetical protein